MKKKFKALKIIILINMFIASFCVLANSIPLNIVSVDALGDVTWNGEYKVREENKKFNPKLHLANKVHIVEDRLWKMLSGGEQVYEEAYRMCDKLPIGGLKWRLPKINDYESLSRDSLGKEYSEYYWVFSPKDSNDGSVYRPAYSNGSKTKKKDKRGGYSRRYVTCVTYDKYMHFNLDELVDILIKEKNQSEKLNLPSQPETIPYPQKKILIKGEFEKTNEFLNRQEQENKKHLNALEAIDKQNDEEKINWNARVSQLKKEYQKTLEKRELEKNSIALDMIKEAVHVLYGKPKINNVEYDADEEEFNIEIVSQNKKNPIESIVLKNALKNKVKISNESYKLKEAYLFKDETILKMETTSPIWKFYLPIKTFNANYAIYKNQKFRRKSRYEYHIFPKLEAGEIFYLSLHPLTTSYYTLRPSEDDTESINIDLSIKSEYTYAFKENISVPVQIKYAKKFKDILTSPNFVPTIEFDIIDKKLELAGIAEIKDPENLVVGNLYEFSKSNSKSLEAFISSYPESPFTAKAKTRLAQLLKQEKETKERNERIKREQRLAKERRIKENAEQERLSKIAMEKAERDFVKLGSCSKGSTVIHKEKWNTTTSSGNIIADGLFGAATKEKFIIYYEGVVEGFVGNKVKVTINDYQIKQTKGGKFFQPRTNRAYEISKHADKFIGKTQFYLKSRCTN